MFVGSSALQSFDYEELLLKGFQHASKSPYNLHLYKFYLVLYFLGSSKRETLVLLAAGYSRLVKKVQFKKYL